ncbi:MAG TPA: DUF2304 domain-containing protein [Xanthobacteraceae bacterium]|nr:DUF2304 domain-containing protein [Xanthobacteraceae bacterium]
MIAQLLLTILLCAILLYAFVERRRSPFVSVLSLVAAAAGLYFVWNPSHASVLAELAGIGRGVDLIIYTWVVISLLVLLNLHLKLRAQTESLTMLARALAIGEAMRDRAREAAPGGAEPAGGGGAAGARVTPRPAPTRTRSRSRR